MASMSLRVRILVGTVASIVLAMNIYILAAYSSRRAPLQMPTSEEMQKPTPPNDSVSKKSRGADLGSELNDMTLMVIEEKEPDWKLIKNEWSPQTESSYKVWRSGEKYMSVFINALESVDAASDSIEKSKQPSSSSLGIKGNELYGIGDRGGHLRIFPSTTSASLSFSVGKFLLTLDGEKSDILRLAKHFEEVLRDHLRD